MLGLHRYHPYCIVRPFIGFEGLQPQADWLILVRARHVMTLAVNRDTTIVDHFDWFRCAVVIFCNYLLDDCKKSNTNF
jgi:hypothetical protein